MARTVDTELRERILNDCVEAALKSGIQNISLSQLSKVTGVSRRMLIYHFGSVEVLVAQTLSGAQERIRDKLHAALAKDQRLDSRRAILTLWEHNISPEMEEPIRAYMSLYMEALADRERYRDFISFTVRGWISWTEKELSEHKPQLTENDLTLILSILRGLLLDYWATRDRTRTTKALKSFLDGYFPKETKLLGKSSKNSKEIGSANSTN